MMRSSFMTLQTDLRILQEGSMGRKWNSASPKRDWWSLPSIWNRLNDRDMMGDERERGGESIVVCSRSSGSLSGALKSVFEIRENEKYQTERRQISTKRKIADSQVRLVSFPDTWVDLKLKQPALECERGGNGTMTICWAWCSRRGIDWWIFH